LRHDEDGGQCNAQFNQLRTVFRTGDPDWDEGGERVVHLSLRCSAFIG